MRLSYAIVLVSDMQRSVAFYRDVLGLPLRFESPAWNEFATEGATLALHTAGEANAAAAPAAEAGPGQCRPGFRVADLGEFHERMQRHQVPCVQPPREVFGARIAQYVDPDGLLFSVGEEPRTG